MSNASGDYIKMALDILQYAKDKFDEGDFEGEEWYIKSAMVDIENALEKIKQENQIKRKSK